ncbi:hypothetical protein Dvina_14280 [Dactylosporangium vinaceum]|uniref:Uncharacterized protein n=1 Tax=Dactylosporangium vinaceum TaxID=53362 RepID=A0ABV5MHS1_9ACTN|nr:hypothetical protein [Dactylosporangium vinaceum]UAB99134.1 hypothetical protein Dvina_14280 [Dactylosporangium vinaceum]
MAYAYQPQQAWNPYPVRSTAPISLHVVAMFQYLGGVLFLGAAALMALAAAKVGPSWQLPAGNEVFNARTVTTAAYVMAGTVALIGLIALILGRKLQNGRNWVRILLTLLNGLSIAGGVYQGYISGAPYATTLISVAFPLLFVILLNTRAARGWCHYRTY